MRRWGATIGHTLVSGIIAATPLVILDSARFDDEWIATEMESRRAEVRARNSFPLGTIINTDIVASLRRQGDFKTDEDLVILFAGGCDACTIGTNEVLSLANQHQRILIVSETQRDGETLRSMLGGTVLHRRVLVDRGSLAHALRVRAKPAALVISTNGDLTNQVPLLGRLE